MIRRSATPGEGKQASKSTAHMDRSLEKHLVRMLAVLTHPALVKGRVEVLPLMTEGMDGEHLQSFMFIFGYLSCEHAHYWVEELKREPSPGEMSDFIHWFASEATPRILASIDENKKRKKTYKTDTGGNANGQQANRV